MSGMDDLVHLYREDDHTPIRFLGGPSDGRTLTWSTSEPPVMIRLPVEEGPAAAVLDMASEPATAQYDQALDDLGHPKRDEDGALVYTYSGQE
ncbi:hypothetical protein [Streptomyces sp. NPDC088270]|uniref:hypothetical protein n=1 Tax=Streptomyces sp. NPDC088270 TaxID=3160990 RepID=UPI00343683E2